MLSSEICTALSQTHMFNVCAMCTMKERVGLGVGGRNGWGGMFDRKSQATEYQFENASSIPLVDCRPCPSKTTLHPIQTSSGGSTPHSCMHVTQAAEKRKHYLLTCRARLYARVLAPVLVSNGREFCSVSGLKKEGTCQTLTVKGYVLCKAVGCR